MAHLPPLAELEDLAARLGITLDPESAAGLRAAAALDDASALVRAVAGETWVDDEAASGLLDVPDVIATVTMQVALRAYRNPTGAVQATTGDVSVSYGTGTLGRAVFLTSDEKALIRKEVGLASIGSIRGTSDILGEDDDDDSSDDALNLAVDPDIGGQKIPLGPVPWE